MRLDRAAIAALVPHAGAMCLLHEVLEADGERILARAISHRDPSHPLREGNALPALCGVEYAAQAMAVHGALQKGAAQPGMLAALRDVELAAARLDDLAGDLMVEARCVRNESGRLLYEFWIRANERLLLHGRATVVAR
ncbi:MAG TPA: 3-hydroxylacyl-ACP dehydratase [Burkholderiales bacterium]|jgi:predicted hotdog family 3-hydroxylacyl-ACP dehydratase